MRRARRRSAATDGTARSTDRDPPVVFALDDGVRMAQGVRHLHAPPSTYDDVLAAIARSGAANAGFAERKQGILVRHALSRRCRPARAALRPAQAEPAGDGDRRSALTLGVGSGLGGHQLSLVPGGGFSVSLRGASRLAPELHLLLAVEAYGYFDFIPDYDTIVPVFAVDGIVGPGLQFFSATTGGYVLVEAGAALTVATAFGAGGQAAAGIGGTLALGGDLRRFAHGATWFELRCSLERFFSEWGAPRTHYQTAFAVGYRWE